MTALKTLSEVQYVEKREKGERERRGERGVQSVTAVWRSKIPKTHRVVVGEAVLIHLHYLPGGDVEAQDGVVGEDRLLAHELLAQAVLPSLPPAGHGRTLPILRFGTNEKRVGEIQK